MLCLIKKLIQSDNPVLVICLLCRNWNGSLRIHKINRIQKIGNLSRWLIAVFSKKKPKTMTDFKSEFNWAINAYCWYDENMFPKENFLCSFIQFIVIDFFCLFTQTMSTILVEYINKDLIWLVVSLSSIFLTFNLLRLSFL